MTCALLKIPLIFSDAIGMRITGKPPNPPLPRVLHVMPDWRERFLKSLAKPCIFLRTLSWTTEIIEALVIIANHYPEHTTSKIVHSALIFRHGRRSAITITPLFLLGNVLTLVGTLIRLQCYATLGRFFTFELSIQQDHQLVTHGPYTIVRHPSYSGMIMTIIGAMCSHASGSWVVHSGVLQLYIGKVLVGYWLLVGSAVVLSLCLRVAVEDRMLMGRFGDEWIRWRQKVPYALVPGVY